MYRPVIRSHKRVKIRMVEIRGSAKEIQRAARTADRAADAPSSRQDPGPQHEASICSLLGVRDRGKAGYHLELRTGSKGCRKIHAAGFGNDKEHVAMSHDVARLTLFGHVAYQSLPENALNYWEKRDVVAAWFRKDERMMNLADEHRRKDVAEQNWDTDMKTRLKELASEALNLIKVQAQGEPVALQQTATIHSQNIDANLNLHGCSDEGSPFDIDFALEDGAASENWPRTQNSLLSTMQNFSMIPLEDEVEGLGRTNFVLEAKVKELGRANSLLEAKVEVQDEKIFFLEAKVKELTSEVATLQASQTIYDAQLI